MEEVANDLFTIGSVPLVLICMAAAYFVPTFIARFRSHHNFVAIMMVNVLLGWTFLGWVVALVWAFTNPAPAPPQR